MRYAKNGANDNHSCASFSTLTVVTSGLLWTGTPRQLLNEARKQELQLFTSRTLLLELADILSRRKFARKLTAAGLTTEQLVERYAWLATVVRPVTIAPTIIVDPDDDHVLACAITARVEFIVSGDRHLLDLKQYQEIRIVTASEAMSIFKP